MSSEKTFLDTIFFLYFLGKFVGLSCYSITKSPTKYKLSFGVGDFLQFIFFVGIFSAITYLNLQLELNSDENNTRIFNQAQQIQMVLSLLCVIAALFQVLFMRQKFWDIVHAFHDIDNQVIIII